MKLRMYINKDNRIEEKSYYNHNYYKLDVSFIDKGIEYNHMLVETEDDNVNEEVTFLNNDFTLETYKYIICSDSLNYIDINIEIELY